MDESTQDSPVLAAALRYAASGVAVFPTRLYVRGDGRKGVSPIADWDNASTTNADQIRAWFTGTWVDAAVCIDCGKSGIVGVDQDVSDGQTGPANWAALEHEPTFRVASPSGGFHDYYRADPEHPFTVDNTGAVAPGVDIRGMGGFLFAPPSIDPRGGSWQWIDGEPDWAALPMVPEVVAKRMAEKDANKRRKARPAASTAVAAAAVSPAPIVGSSLLFGNGQQERDFGPDGGWKTISAATALLRRETEAFAGLTEQNSGRSHILSQRLAVLAGHGVPGFWTYDVALGILLDACERNGFTDVHGEAYAIEQASRGLQYGMLEPWHVMPEPAPAEAPPVAEVELAPSNLPDDFWTARAGLTLIRASAHSRAASADTVLGGVLARIAAAVPPQCGPDTGQGQVSLNFLVGIVGPSGVGKSKSLGVVGEVMPAGREWDPYSYPLGSGEGIAEAYMGTVDEEGEDGKKKKVRKKVHDNALFSQDEGAGLVSVLFGRAGVTIGEALRSAWSGQALGQQNGRAETTRRIPGGTYAFGATIGFQPEVAGQLFAPEEIIKGTVQRFIWLSSVDPGIPTERVEPVTEKLSLPGKVFRDLGPWDGSLLFAPDEDPEAKRLRQMTLPASIKDRLWAEAVGKARGDITPDVLDSQRPAMLVKISCLMALLDNRLDVTEADWALAERLLVTSDLMRKRIQQAAASEADRRAQLDLALNRNRAAAQEAGRQDQAAACTPGHRAKLLEKLTGQQVNRTVLLKAFDSTHRSHASDVLDALVSEGLVTEVKDGRTTLFSRNCE